MHSNCVHLNDRFLSRMVTPTVLHLPHLSRCERAQHKITMTGSGSFQSFAAFGANARSARDQPICRLRDTRNLPLEPVQITQGILNDH